MLCVLCCAVCVVCGTWIRRGREEDERGGRSCVFLMIFCVCVSFRNKQNPNQSNLTLFCFQFLVLLFKNSSCADDSGMPRKP